MTICTRCNRPVQSGHEYNCVSLKPAKYIKVIHSYYGCDTGCDGHRAYVCDEDGNIVERGSFEFAHPFGQEKLEFAKEIARKLIAAYKVPINEMECEIRDD